MAQRPSAATISSRTELLKLRYEIDADLAAGRLEQWGYDSAKLRIEYALKRLDEPLPPRQDIRVTSIPRKEIDTDKLAQALWLQARRKLRESRRGYPD